MARDIRYKDGTVRHVYSSPGVTNRRRRRPSAGLLFILAGLGVVWLAHLGGHW